MNTTTTRTIKYACGHEGLRTLKDGPAQDRLFEQFEAGLCPDCTAKATLTHAQIVAASYPSSQQTPSDFLAECGFSFERTAVSNSDDPSFIAVFEDGSRAQVNNPNEVAFDGDIYAV